MTPALVVEGPKPPQKSAEQLRAEEAARAWELVASSTDSIALRAFHDRYPQSAHAAEALNIAERIENHAAALAESRKASEAAAALRQEVSVVLQRIQEAYSARDAKQIRAVWPTIDSDHLKRLETAIRETRSMSLVLQPTSEPRRTRNGAVVECRYVQLSALKGSKAPRQMEGTATVILTRSGGSLVIDDIDYRLTSRSLFKPL